MVLGLMQIGKMMRIRKAPRNGVKVTSMRSPSSLIAHERFLWKDVHELISSSDNETVGQLFVHYVKNPLLGSKYVDVGMLNGVSKKFLESVEKNVICQRPAWRVDDAQVDMHRDSVLLMSDHSLFTHGNIGSNPCISVEVKYPKCGFLPLSRFISEGAAIKRRITRFQMHQALKSHRGEISLLSEYNPLDLFFGSMEIIHKAIKGLFTTPQNNFRVFKNGSLIFGGGGAEDTNCCIAKAFEDELKSVIQADDGHCTENLLTLVAEAMRQSGVLDRLLEVQKLDNVDIEGAIHAYYDITHQHCPICRELGEEELKRYSSLHSTSLDERKRGILNLNTIAYILSQLSKPLTPRCGVIAPLAWERLYKILGDFLKLMLLIALTSPTIATMILDLLRTIEVMPLQIAFTCTLNGAVF
ncbi:hypothetical protein Fmac_003824 [Flemingia macrophylla]|uniref:Inositol-pentakisphosphate 2-kinase n=1 Tax=Flemingia macrophylla TaxID=520843 RepID=A0ABD1N3A8_9FABA